MEERESRLTRIVTRMVYLQRSRPWGKVVRLLLWLIGVDIPPATTIASGLRLVHPSAGIVLHPSTEIGRDVTLCQGVTIGRSDAWLPYVSGGVVIGEGAVVGAGAVVLFKSGEVRRVGRYSLIGANAVVTRDIPDGEVWAGNPARCVHGRADSC